MKARIVTTVGAVLLAASAWVGAAEVDMTARLDALELEMRKLRADRPVEENDSLSIGGYGELHYNNLNGSGGASDQEVIDFHRFVLYVGYEFSDRIRFSSELELEHALSGDDQPGEVELEQAFIDFDLTASHVARAGLFLLPIGLLNETHEPTLFYGVERNAVEKNIIPTTWWEAGAGLYGDVVGDLTYGAYLHSGMMTSADDQYSVRAGRQKVAKAVASDPAATVALNWRHGASTLGGSIQYQSDITQGRDPQAGDAWLGELHADVACGPVALRALVAEWSLSGDGPEEIGADRQMGWYVEPSYRLFEPVGLFVRYGEWDNTAGSAGENGRKTQTDVGVNWWPHAQVVVKADYQWQVNENGQEQDGFNLGLGYRF